MIVERQPVQLLETMRSVLLARQTEHGDKVEELVVGVRPLHRGFRYGGNICLPEVMKLLNCDALEVYVDSGQKFTLYSGSDMEVRPGTTVRMEVERKGRSGATIEPIVCTFYERP
jgi:hypothetical protein